MTNTDTRPPAAPGGPAGEPDPRVLAMARAFDRTRRKVEGLDAHVAQLSEDVTRLAGVVTAGRPPGGPPGGSPPDGAAPDADGADGPGAVPEVRSWLLTVDPEQAAADLADLIEWLNLVYLRYPGAELSACWLWHPHVIEELWWLCKSHADAFHPTDGSWLRVGDWHDRQRPAAAKRVRDAVGSCDLSLHAPSKPHGQPLAVAPLAGHAAEIAAAWATGRTRPEPTEAQLAEGEAHFQALYRNSR